MNEMFTLLPTHNVHAHEDSEGPFPAASFVDPFVELREGGALCMPWGLLSDCAVPMPFSIRNAHSRYPI